MFKETKLETIELNKTEEISENDEQPLDIDELMDSGLIDTMV